MMKTPLVSVVIAAFNAEACIANAIESAQRQTIRDIEIIVVDDASVDNTAAIVECYVRQDRRVRLLPMECNGGPGAARNTGFRHARGDWLAVLDSDDAFSPVRLERLLSLASESHYEMLSDNLLLRFPDHDRQMIDDERAVFDISAIEFVKQNRRSRQQGRSQYGFLKPMIQRDFLQKHEIGYLPMRLAEDYFLALLCLVEGARWRITREPLYLYTMRDDSLSAVIKPSGVDAIVAANSWLLEHPRVKGDIALARVITESRNAAYRAALWTRIVTALRGGQWREAARLCLRDRAAFGAVISGLQDALRKRRAASAMRSPASHVGRC